MKIARVNVKNYRAIDDLEIQFDEHINVIYGINGVGKTSILYLINDICAFMNGMLPELKIIFPEKRIKSKDKNPYFSINFNNGDETSCEGKIKEGKLEFMPPKNGSIKPIKFFPGLTSQYLENKFIDPGKFETRIYPQPYFTYTRGIFDLVDLKTRIKEAIDEENKQKVKEYKEKNLITFENPALRKIRQTLSKFIDDFEGIDVIKSDIDPLKNLELIIQKKDGSQLNIEDQLSAGEASIVGLLASISMANAEPGINNKIVLIDEIDTSLHPQWQIRIPSILKTNFPDLQFIMTSHSPYIWAGLEKNEVIWLSKDRDGFVKQIDVPYAMGGDFEDISAKYFAVGGFDQKFNTKVEEAERFIANKDREGFNNIIDEMEKEFGPVPMIDRLKFKMEMSYI